MGARPGASRNVGTRPDRGGMPRGSSGTAAPSAKSKRRCSRLSTRTLLSDRAAGHLDGLIEQRAR
eukprot:6830166-Pyramimonas_sp.AAC.1